MFLLLIYNIMGILCNTFAKVWIDDPSKKIPYLDLEAVCTFFRDAAYNLAHWLFGFKYWVIAYELDLAI